MSTQRIRFQSVCASLGATFIGLTLAAGALAADPAGAKTAQGASLLGAALPGGAVISAMSVAVAPVEGGTITATPVGSDGMFRAAGLKPGAYRLALTTTTVARQTQGATFGEKVNAGLHAAGSAIAQGASRSPPETTTASAARSGINGINSNGMPNRISMNVTVAKQTQQVVVDDTIVAVEVGSDGLLTGRVTAP